MNQIVNVDWSQIYAIIGVNVAMFASLATLVIWAINKMDNDVSKACSRLDGHAARIDQLYNMFVDLLKEKK